MALAHVIWNNAEAAYRRGHLLDKRCSLMEEWAAHLGLCLDSARYVPQLCPISCLARSFAVGFRLCQHLLASIALIFAEPPTISTGDDLPNLYVDHPPAMNLHVRQLHS